MAAALAKDICFICGKPSTRSYPLKKFITCDKLVHRRCTQTPVGQDSLCSSCSKVKETKKDGNTDTPPHSVNTVDPTSQRLQLKTKKAIPIYKDIHLAQAVF